MAPVRAKIRRVLRKAVVCAWGKTAGMAAEILKLEQALFTFVDVEGVEPTNNAAERRVRPAVIYRKLSFLRQQNRNVLEYLTTAYAAHLAGAPAPSLLPTGTT